MIEKTLFALLRLGLGTSTDIQKENISDLFVASEMQWKQLEETARFQGVSGIVLDGLKKVMDELGPSCFSRNEKRAFWKEFILQWIGTVTQGYEVGNMQQKAVADNIQRLWAENGILKNLVAFMMLEFLGIHLSILCIRTMTKKQCFKK